MAAYNLSTASALWVNSIYVVRPSMAIGLPALVAPSKHVVVFTIPTLVS